MAAALDVSHPTDALSEVRGSCAVNVRSQRIRCVLLRCHRRRAAQQRNASVVNKSLNERYVRIQSQLIANIGLFRLTKQLSKML